MIVRPTLLGLVGDSAAGKTTITRGLVRVLGEEQVTHVCLDDYHRYDRAQREERDLTPLDPRCNYIDIMASDLARLRQGSAILKPVYRHADGTFAAPVYVEPKRFTIVEGMLGFHSEALRSAYALRVFLMPPEVLRRHWKVQRDCSRRAYTTDAVLAQLDRRERDADRYIRPQASYADIAIAFRPRDNTQLGGELDAELLLRLDLPHPDLEPFADAGVAILDRGREQHVHIAGTISDEATEHIQAALWDRLHFARHLQPDRLGEYTIGTALHRSNPLALVQLLLLHYLVTACASAALSHPEVVTAESG